MAWTNSTGTVEALSKTRLEGLCNFFEEAGLFRVHSMFGKAGMEIVILLMISCHTTIGKLRSLRTSLRCMRVGAVENLTMNQTDA